MKEELSLKPEDSEDLIDLIRGIQGVIVAAFFEELPDGKIRVSLRAKDSSVNCSELAQRFKGGGHARAAGIRMPGPLADRAPASARRYQRSPLVIKDFFFRIPLK